MSIKTIALGLVVLGVLILLTAFLAGPLHLAGSTFGPKKIIATVVGVIVLGVGIYLRLPKKASQ